MVLVIVGLSIFMGFSFKKYTPEEKIQMGQIIYTSMEDIFPLTQDDVVYNLKVKLYKYHRTWDPKTINWLASTLLLGQRLYDIDHRIILNICDIESNFDINIKHLNLDKTWDWGIVQCNDKNRNEYIQAEKVLDNNKIWHTYSNDMLDPAIGIMSAYIYLNWSRDKLINQRDFSHKRWIVSYNCGYSGSDPRIHRYQYLETKRKSYWSNYCVAQEN
jgi:hypothetical protein